MTQIANYINTYSDNTAYSADQSKDFPNISYIQANDNVKWNKYDPEYVVCKYNVTSTESATQLLRNDKMVRNYISKQIIDGVKQQSVVFSYTFSTTGEHIVKYKVNSNYGRFYNGSFQGCINLISFTFPDTLKNINDTLFYGCTNLKDFKIQNHITNIGTTAFYGCNALTNITIPSNVKTFGNHSFRDCTGLLSATVESATVGNGLFITCGHLTTVTLGSGVTEILSSAFQNCTALTSVTIEATTPPTLGSNALAGTNANLVIYVPSESVNAYKTATNWSTYASRIRAIPTT